MSNLSDIAFGLAASDERARIASEQLKKMVNGPEGVEVETDTGPVPTVKEFLRQAKQQIDQTISEDVGNLSQAIEQVDEARNETQVYKEQAQELTTQATQFVQEGFNAFGDATDPDKGAGLVGTILPAAGARPRTQAEKNADTVHINEFYDGEGDVAPAVANALAFAVPRGKTIEFDGNKTYPFSLIDFTTGAVLRTNGAIFRNDGAIAGTSAVMVLRPGVRFDRINLSMPPASTRRPLAIWHGVEGDYVSVIADEQIGADSMLDCAVQFIGGSKVFDVFVRNYDHGVIGFHDPATPVQNLSTGFIEIESYAKGVQLRNVGSGSIQFIKASGMSPLATNEPGNNSILTSGVQNFTIGGYDVSDAPEHGIRVGGTYGDELPTQDLRFGPGKIQRPGKCAFKVNPTPEKRVKRLTIDSFTAVDCAYGNAVNINEDVLRIEKTDGVTVGKVTGLKDTKSNCSYDGLHIADCTGVSVQDYYFDTPARAGVYITDTGDSQVGAITDMSIKGGVIKRAGGGSIIVDAPTTTVVDLQIDGWTSVSPTGAAVSFTSAGVSGYVSVSGDSYNPSTQHYTGAMHAGISVDILANGKTRMCGAPSTAGPMGAYTIFDVGFDPASYPGVSRGTVVLASTDTAASGKSGPGIVWTQPQSTRRRAAIASYASSANVNQWGIGIYTYGQTTAGSDVLSMSALFTHDGRLRMPFTPTFADEAAASGLPAGTFYKTPTGELRVKL